MRIDLSWQAPDGTEQDVAVTAPAGTRLDQLRHHLCEASGPICSGARALPGGAALGGPGLRTGDVLSLGPPGASGNTTAAGLRLHVVCGPDAGRIRQLHRGTFVVGRAPGCDVVLDDPDVSRRHVEISVSGYGLTVRDLGTANGTTVDGQQVGGGASTWPLGALLRVGDSYLCAVLGDDIPAALRPGPDGSRLVNRSPRRELALPQRTIGLPDRAAA